MKNLIQYTKLVESILYFQLYYPNRKYRTSIFLLEEKVEDGVLIYNSLTYELYLLTDKEYNDIFVEKNQNATFFIWFVWHWFLIDEETDEVTVARNYRKALRDKHALPILNKFDTYTILPTLNCNARCYYCYEKNRAKRTMSEDTALKVVDFIKETKKSDLIHLDWFGGEPLVNSKIITLISDKLIENNIQFYSNMTSNGYLFNQTDIDIIKNVWKLNLVQITLDGTEEYYNKTKNYVNSKPNAYEVVLQNIGLLLDAKIKVVVRMNLCKDNAEEIKKLINTLILKYSSEYLSMYVLPISESVCIPPIQYTKEEKEDIINQLNYFYDYLIEIGYSEITPYNLQKVCIHNCMVDNGYGIVITPEGNFTLCEASSDEYFVGNINNKDNNFLDPEKVELWKEYLEIPECQSCCLLPRCTILKQCISQCTEISREFHIHKIRYGMLKEYEKYKKEIKG